MTKFDNHLGQKIFSQSYFSEVVGHAAQSCFGVTKMIPYGAYQGIRSRLKKEMPNKGVKVIQKDGQLYIAVHIEVAYGVNFNAVAESIISEVRYEVEKTTGLKVAHVDVYIDSVSEN